jgi:hypothetical protein
VALSHQCLADYWREGASADHWCPFSAQNSSFQDPHLWILATLPNPQLRESARLCPRSHPSHGSFVGHVPFLSNPSRILVPHCLKFKCLYILAVTLGACLACTRLNPLHENKQKAKMWVIARHQWLTPVILARDQEDPGLKSAWANSS